MSDVARKFHEAWLGMVQPIDGLVLSVPVLVDADAMVRHPPALQERFLALCPEGPGNARSIRDLREFLDELLELRPDYFDAGEALPADLSLWVEEGRQLLRPTLALRKRGREETPEKDDLLPDDSTPASRAGAPYAALVWDLPSGLPLDKPETITGPWEYPPAAKFDRLLRACRVPIGLLTNREAVRLVYSPHGESSGSITFRIADMATVGGRPILDAFVTLLSAQRFFGVLPEHQLPSLLAESRRRQANVTNELAEQVFEALGILLRGFEAAAARDGTRSLDDALARGDDHVYGGLLTVLLRLVFLLYAEDRGLLPVENELYAEHLSVLGLFEQLQADAAAHPDSMARRYGAWNRLLALFRAVFLGGDHGSLQLPARRGQLFDPEAYPFLEGWGPSGAAPILDASERAQVRVPTVDDETVFLVLHRLLVFQGQRLSYRALDVEQIGSVYEALMGYHVLRLPSAAVCVRPSKTWVPAGPLLEETPARRAAWLEEEAGLPPKDAKALAAKLKGAKTEEEVLEILEAVRVKGTERAAAGRLVLQPGSERRRTSSHYTPRGLSAPIVKRTLEPLLAAMGGTPSSERLLNLKICDPAMGSGAFLVEACRFLGDQVVAAWTREGKLDKVASTTDDVVNHARRLVAQRCLYGVDKNPFAVNLAKLSMWLVTLAKDEPFTFLDHALRHGDSLVGLDFDQIRAFHWKPERQLEFCAKELDRALREALELRQEILRLAEIPGDEATRRKERLLADAEDATARARLLADLVVGAWFAGEKEKDRKAERNRRLELVTAWLKGSGGPPPAELRELQAELRAKVPAFHWMLEFPEVFHGERPDPLDADQPNRVAWMDAFVGNPPFSGKNGITAAGGPAYLPWLLAIHEPAHGNADLSAHFFRRCFRLLGAHGTLGLIATNTIAQGDTRASGLQRIVAEGGVIYDATRSMKWPGEANVAVSVVHVTKGMLAAVQGLARRLDGAVVPAVNSRLRGKPERPDPVRLQANADLSFVGSYVLGMGFILTPEERETLVARDPRNAERVFPYLGGEEVNTSPTQAFDRYVIHFGDLTLEEAERWPDLIRIVRERVKPQREQDNREIRRRYWWRFGEIAPALYLAIRGLPRCLVTSQVSKHLVFAWEPCDLVFSHTLYVFAFQQQAKFGLLQSRIHEAWARLLASSLEDRMRYRASECFETFPFPHPETLADQTPLADIAERLYTARARYMVDTNQGLTATYNRLVDPACTDAPVVALRRLHEDLDRAVLAAYGWSDLPVPPYGTPTTPAATRAIESFSDEVIDRLFALNAARADAERLRGGAAPRPTPRRPRAAPTQLTLPEHD